MLDHRLIVESLRATLDSQAIWKHASRQSSHHIHILCGGGGVRVALSERVYVRHLVVVRVYELTCFVVNMLDIGMDGC